MQIQKRTISPLVFFILVSSMTNLTFLVAGMIILALSSVILSNTVVGIIVFLLLWKGALVGFVSWGQYRKAQNKDFLVKFIGIYFGRFFGIFAGGYLGAKIARVFGQTEIAGGIIGALTLYFLGRWLGARVSAIIGRQVDSVFSISRTPEPVKSGETRSTRRIVLLAYAMYGMILPLLFVVVGLLITWFKIPVGQLTELLPVSRSVVVVLSVFSVSSPWLMKNRWLRKSPITTTLSEPSIYWLGLVWSILPTIYGFLLFMAMGASIFELCFFAGVSSIAAIIWCTKNFSLIRQESP